MVYVDKDGRIHEGNKPWGLSKLLDLIWAPINCAVFFVQTLINPAMNSIEGRPYTIGGSNLGQSTSAPRPRPSRYGRMGRFRSMSQIAPPPAPGSCRSCMM